MGWRFGKPACSLTSFRLTVLLIMILNQPAWHRQVFLTHPCLNTVLMLYPKIKLMMNLRWTAPIPPVRNQSILATPTISVYTTPKSSQYILTMNSSTLNAKLVSPETKMCDKMMAITSYFKNELQFWKKCLLTRLRILATLAIVNQQIHYRIQTILNRS